MIAHVADPLASYWRSPRWQQLRTQALHAASGKCERCGAERGLSVHHRTYDRLFIEQVRDLQVLCKRCHGQRHGKVAV